MIYTIYKITNKLNNKIYIGAHTTEDISDNYMGSGAILKKAIEKYGLDNFYKEVLYTFTTEEEMYLKEAELVNEEFIQRDDTYNLKVGGYGGWSYINENKLNNTEKNRLSRLKNLEKANEANKKLVAEGKHRKGFKISAETKLKMSLNKNRSFPGEKNPQYGKKCVNKNGKNLMILKEEVNDYIKKGWELGQIQNKPDTKGNKNASFGKSWYTNGEESKLLSQEESIKYISLGWTKGRTLKKSKTS